MPQPTLWQDLDLAATLQGVHLNNVLFYFARSPFCDQSSNNVTVFTQSELSADLMQQNLATLPAFHAALARLSGLEYRVVDHGALHGPDTPATVGWPNTQRFVIRKQRREKRPRADDRIDVLAAYVVLGTVVLPAPTLKAILDARMLNLAASFARVVRGAEALRYWTPATGHTLYHPQQHRAPLQSRGRDGAAASVATSRAASPAGSDAAGGSVLGEAEDKDETGVATQEAFAESFALFARYRGEYMDENPLVGEPGHFTFKTSKAAIQQQREAEERAAREKEELERRTRQRMQEALEERRRATPTPTPQPPGEAARRSSASKTKVKRKKSRAPGSPTSPLSAVASPMATSPE